VEAEDLSKAGECDFLPIRALPLVGKQIDEPYASDGVCVVPRAADQEVFRGAFEKARGEKTVRKALEQGMSAREAFEKFGIL
jgi:hypothetical protein